MLIAWRIPWQVWTYISSIGLKYIYSILTSKNIEHWWHSSENIEYPPDGSAVAIASYEVRPAIGFTYVSDQAPMMHKMVSQRKRKFVSQRKCKYSENKLHLRSESNFCQVLRVPAMFILVTKNKITLLFLSVYWWIELSNVLLSNNILLTSNASRNTKKQIAHTVWQT